MTIPTEIELIRQDIDKLKQRIEDVATAEKRAREEIDATTEMVRDHHLWIVHGDCPPALRRKTPFEP